MHTAYYRRFLKNCVAELACHSFDAIVVNTYIQYLPEFRRALPEAVIAAYLHDELVAHLPTSFVQARLADADRVVCVRKHICGQLRQRLPSLSDRLKVVALGVDPSRFHPAEKGEGRRGGPILFVGRLSPEKGLHVLGAAFADVHRHFPDVRLKLVGSPGMMPFAWIRSVSSDDAMKSLWRYYGKSEFDRFRQEVVMRGRGYVEAVKDVLGPACAATDFVGPVPYGSLPQIYRDASMLVSPSVCMELPTPVYEAMGSGIPALLTYEAREEGVVRDGTTVVRVPRNDTKALAEAMLHMIKNPVDADHIGHSARQAILKDGTWSVRASSLIRLLEEAISLRARTHQLGSAEEKDTYTGDRTRHDPR
jgi:glycosyltransferase involved in cell wall biosynthesis